MRRCATACILNFEGQAEGIQPDDVITDLLERVPVPVGSKSS